MYVLKCKVKHTSNFLHFQQWIPWNQSSIQIPSKSLTATWKYRGTHVGLAGPRFQTRLCQTQMSVRSQHRVNIKIISREVHDHSHNHHQKYSSPEIIIQIHHDHKHHYNHKHNHDHLSQSAIIMLITAIIIIVVRQQQMRSKIIPPKSHHIVMVIFLVTSNCISSFTQTWDWNSPGNWWRFLSYQAT